MWGLGRDSLRMSVGRLIGIVLSLLLLSACASGSRQVDHAFGFDAVADSPGAEVLDYRYGQSRAPGVRMPEWVKKDIGVAGGTHTSGAMAIGENLYVRWRLRDTGEVLQDTVDLRGRLPADMAGHEIYFIVRRRQLLVYVVSPGRLGPGEVVAGMEKFRQHKVRLIYPG
jgi:hypothetical protein